MSVSRVAVLEPLDVPWLQKPIDSAQTKIEILPDGRLKASIVHDVLKGVTPRMLVWWFQNIEGTIEVDDRTINRYRYWHPLDHIAHAYVRRLPDGSVGPGTIMRITEALGRNPRFLVNNLTLIEKLDETGFQHSPMLHGLKLAKMEYTFTPTKEGTLYENSIIVGATGPFRHLFNTLIRPRAFSEEKARAWLKHNVEEVGNLEFFLPRLYESEHRIK